MGSQFVSVPIFIQLWHQSISTTSKKAKPPLINTHATTSGGGREESEGAREGSASSSHLKHLSLSVSLAGGSCELIRAKRTATLQRSLGFHTPPLSAATSLLSLPLPLFTPSLHCKSVCTTLFPWKAKRNIKLQLGEAPKNITSGRQNAAASPASAV